MSTVLFTDLPGCCPQPTEHTWCAAAYLVYLEHTSECPPMVPSGEPTLCAAHQIALADQIVSANMAGGYGYTDEELRQVARDDTRAFIAAALVLSIRLAAKYR